MVLEKFKNQYKIESSRLRGYNYSQSGMYFVTICTKDKEEFFGSIKDRKMILNDIGKMADKFWQEIPKHFPVVNLDIYQIMPNHIHGIIEIINNNSVETPKLGVSTKTANWMSGCLGVIINQYKRICTIEIKKQSNLAIFAWQSRFYDHVIRNNKSLQKIREYIINNPAMWERDRNLFTKKINNHENLWI